MTNPHPSDFEPSPFTEALDPIDPAEREANAAFADGPGDEIVPDIPERLPAAIPEQRLNVTSSMAALVATIDPGSHGHLVGIADPANAVHPFNGECKVCQHRLAEYEEFCRVNDKAPMDPPKVNKLEVLWRQIHPVLAPGWFAVNCCDSCYEAAKSDNSRVEQNRAAWLRVCPTEFSKDWDNRKGDCAALTKALEFDPEKKRGMCIHGPTDSSKTRIAWQVAKKLAEAGIAFLFIESIDLLDAIPPEALNVPVLIIDDLGNDGLSSKNETRFLKLLRARANWHRPFIITTQFVGDGLLERFSDSGTGHAIVRRIRQECDFIEAKPSFGGVKGIAKSQFQHA